MHNIDVHNEVIRGNLDLLKHLLQRARKTQQPDFEALVETSTGCLMLPEKTHKEHWKAIRIRWVADSAHNSGSFEIYEQMKDRTFETGDLSKKARQTLSDTMHTINQIFAKEVHEKGFERAMIFLEETIFTSPDTEIYDSLFHKEVTREIAEQMLQGKNAGTFFFRKDPYGQILEEELSDKFKEAIKCFTLTALTHEDQVVDYTIVERYGKFQIYDDDPMLDKPSFDSLHELLGTLKHICTYPLRR